MSSPAGNSFRENDLQLSKTPYGHWSKDKNVKERAAFKQSVGKPNSSLPSAYNLMPSWPFATDAFSIDTPSVRLETGWHNLRRGNRP